jgi:hypothetical protein
VFEATGRYRTAFLFAAILAFLGGVLTLIIRDQPVRSRATPTPLAA